MLYKTNNPSIENTRITLSKSRKKKIILVTTLNLLCESNKVQKDNQINPCVVHDKNQTNIPFIFIPTDIRKNLKRIANTYK